MRFRILVFAAIATSACSAKASEELLAKELLWTSEGPGWIRSIEFSPSMATQPHLVRRLKAERIKAMGKPPEEGCGSMSDELIKCEEFWTYKLQYEGDRLVSVLASNTDYSGGAHHLARNADYLFDEARGKPIRFGNIFTDWPHAKRLLQRSFCQSLRDLNRDYICPSIEDQAITLVSSGDDKASGFVVTTQDYAIGSYADGQETVRIELTPNVAALLRPEYRDEFVIQDPGS